MEPVNNTKRKLILSDKTFRIVERISFLLLIVPYAMLMSSILLDIFTIGDYFVLFPIALLSFFPIGIFAILIQIIRKIQKNPPDHLNGLVFVCSLITVIIGVLAYMLIYVVTE